MSARPSRQVAFDILPNAQPDLIFIENNARRAAIAKYVTNVQWVYAVNALLLATDAMQWVITQGGNPDQDGHYRCGAKLQKQADFTQRETRFPNIEPFYIKPFERLPDAQPGTIFIHVLDRRAAFVQHIAPDQWIYADNSSTYKEPAMKCVLDQHGNPNLDGFYPSTGAKFLAHLTFHQKLTVFPDIAPYYRTEDENERMSEQPVGRLKLTIDDVKMWQYYGKRYREQPSPTIGEVQEWIDDADIHRSKLRGSKIHAMGTVTEKMATLTELGISVEQYRLLSSIGLDNSNEGNFSNLVGRTKTALKNYTDGSFKPPSDDHS